MSCVKVRVMRQLGSWSLLALWWQLSEGEVRSQARPTAGNVKPCLHARMPLALLDACSMAASQSVPFTCAPAPSLLAALAAAVLPGNWPLRHVLVRGLIIECRDQPRGQPCLHVVASHSSIGIMEKRQAAVPYQP